MTSRPYLVIDHDRTGQFPLWTERKRTFCRPSSRGLRRLLLLVIVESGDFRVPQGPQAAAGEQGVQDEQGVARGGNLAAPPLT